MKYLGVFKNFLKNQLELFFFKCDRTGDSLLTKIFKKCSTKIPKLLMYLGLNINTPNKKGETPLWAAITSKKYDLINLLIENNTDINKGFNGDTPLTYACKKNDTKLLALLLKHPNLNINLTNTFGKTPLYVACLHGNLDIVKILLQNNANINYKNKTGESPLWAACKYGYSNIVDLLIQNNVDVNTTNNNGDSPLWAAIISKNISIVKLLLQNNADVSQKDMCNLDTPLLFACEKQNVPLLKLLIQYKADVNYTNMLGQTPLWIAIIKKDMQIIEILLNNNANVNKQYLNGNTPLIAACKTANLRLVKLLLQFNADVNKSNNFKHTPLLISCIYKKFDLAELLIQHGANIYNKGLSGGSPFKIICKEKHIPLLKLIANIKNSHDQTPLYMACENADFRFIKLLVSVGADVNIECNQSSPLLCSIKKLKLNINTPPFVVSFHKRIIQYLISNNANINIVLGNSTPLIEAINCDFDLTKYLVDHGANVNLITNCTSPLLEAIKQDQATTKYLVDKGADVDMIVDQKAPLLETILLGHEHLTKYLIEHGANTNITNSDGETPLSLVVKSKTSIDLAKLLIANNANLNALYNKKLDKSSKKFVKEILNDPIVQILIALRNEDEKKLSSKNPLVVNTLRKKGARIIPKITLDMATSMLFNSSK